MLFGFKFKIKNLPSFCLFIISIATATTFYNCRNIEKVVDEALLSNLLSEQNIRDQGYVKFDSLGNILVEFNNTHFKNNPLYSELSYIGVWVFRRGADITLNCCTGNATVCGSASLACIRGVGFSQDLGFLGRRYIFREPPQTFNKNADKYYMPIKVSDNAGVPRDYQGEYTPFSGPTNPVGDREQFDLYIGVFINLFDPELRRLRPINLEADIGTQTYYTRIAPDFLSPRIPIESRFFSQRPEDLPGNWYKIPSMAVWSRPPPLDTELDKRGRIRINEIGNAIGNITANDYIEIYNTFDKEISLDDVFIQRYTSTACSTLVSATQTMDLTGFSIPPRGFITIARPGHTLNNINGTFTGGLNIGPNDCIALTKGRARIRSPLDDRVIDFVGFSDPNSQNQFRGAPTTTLFNNSAISRCPDGADSRNNRDDFFLEAPTPGLANQCQFAPQPEPIQNAQPGEILISEVLITPATNLGFEGGFGDDCIQPGDNFVELVNTSNKRYNLGGARLFTINSSGNVSIYYTFPSFVLEPGEYVAVVSQDKGCYTSESMANNNRKALFRSPSSVTSPFQFFASNTMVLTKTNTAPPDGQVGPAITPGDAQVLDYVGWTGATGAKVFQTNRANNCISPNNQSLRRINNTQNTGDNQADFICGGVNGTPGRGD